MDRPILTVALITMFIGSGVSVMAQQRQDQSGRAWSDCCGMEHWPMMGPGWMMGPGGMMGKGMGGSMPRHHATMMSGVPAPYNALSNPLPKTRETIERGARVYADNCAACHGATGAGDGAAGRELSPPPANLAWLAEMPMVQWDSFIYWTIAEGGTQFRSAMPAFKDGLAKDDIWAVIAYIRARLPQSAK
ncbi:cytochrome c [Rhodoblastus sp.]|jgi:mono/diheme cytochrome c family protein|uniref:c-type cytochrome n=1 Tax=Rhodoblastus sp. TaxID=1962975 RepID=UPI0025E59481|nr:cytochrome c [Rhodoblastus sp.]